MATFSPSPTPRRTSRLRPPNSPTPIPRRIKINNSRAASRLTTPARTTDNASVAPSMDVDESHSIATDRALVPKGDAIFAKSAELSVTFYAHLPAEVKQVLKNADFYGDPYTGDIDTLTGFALVASAQTCFVWQHAQAVKGTPTCYIFSCPPENNYTSPPLHGLVPYGYSREPGLILISPSGDIRFWDSIGIGLAGGDHYSTSTVGLGEDESVTNLLRSDAQTYIATTSVGRFFRISLTSYGGKHHLASHAFSRPASTLSFSRLLPSIFSSSTAYSSASAILPEAGNVNAVALGEATSTGGREIWALVDTRVQKWDVKAEGWEEILIDEDVAGDILGEVRRVFGKGVSGDDASLDLELLDLAVEGEGKLVVLVSYAGLEDTSMSVDMSGVRRIYVLVRLTNTAGIFKVESVGGVPYQSTSTSGAPMHPRIQLILKGSLVSIQFGDAVALCARDSVYENRLELKSATDRTLGVGVVESDSCLLVLSASTMMKAYVDMDQVKTFDSETGRANIIKSIMTQAILYGSSPENPLHFSFPPEVDEDSLMQGAEQLSQAVLESDSEVVRRDHNLGAQMTARKERLSWLIRFINDNAVLTKMSQQSRQRLATDAEKLYACYQLWLQHNELMVTYPAHSVLVDAVDAYMNEINEGHHEDVIRAFFRFHVGDIGKLVRKVMDVTLQSQQDPGRGPAAVLPEANRIVLIVLKSAFDYREYNFGVYGITLPMIKPWTSKLAVIDIVLALFDSTTGLIDAANPEDDATIQGSEPHSQLPDLAAVLFACIRERLDWLGSPAAGDEAGADRDKGELEQKFALLRPEVLETLRRNGHNEAAFMLAEKYRDFSSLAALCHRDTVYPPEENPNFLRVQVYLDKFKDEFATELYRWYIHHGELRVMFAQEDAQSGFMDRFFAANPNSAVSWIHDLGKARYGAAAKSLLVEAQHTTKLESRHLMFSIGKLSLLAELQEAGASADESALDAFHDGLDFVSVHEALLTEYQEVLQAKLSRQSLDSQIDSIVKAKASTLSDRRALLHVFREWIRDLLQCKVLSAEDIVDLLTLKDNTEKVEDYSTALHLLARVTDLPDVRRTSAFRSIWRRIYIHDDWDFIRRTANVSDDELNERFRRTALYSALLTAMPPQHQLEHCIFPPDAAQVIPTSSEIASRWPGVSPDQVDALSADYQQESDTLEQLSLGDVYHRARELAAQAIMLDGHGEHV